MSGALSFIIVIIFIILSMRKKSNKASAEAQNIKNRVANNVNAANNAAARATVSKPIASTGASKPGTTGTAPRQVAQRPAPSRPQASSTRRPVDTNSAKMSRQVKQNSTASAKAKRNTINSLMEDRNNDWLANQLRDEHKAFNVVSDMFGLKIEHASHCDAKYVQDFHGAHCDSGKVDTASGI